MSMKRSLRLHLSLSRSSLESYLKLIPILLTVSRWILFGRYRLEQASLGFVVGGKLLCTVGFAGISKSFPCTNDLCENGSRCSTIFGRVQLAPHCLFPFPVLNLPTFRDWLRGEECWCRDKSVLPSVLQGNRVSFSKPHRGNGGVSKKQQKRWKMTKR